MRTNRLSRLLERVQRIGMTIGMGPVQLHFISPVVSLSPPTLAFFTFFSKFLLSLFPPRVQVRSIGLVCRLPQLVVKVVSHYVDQRGEIKGKNRSGPSTETSKVLSTALAVLVAAWNG